MLSRIGAAKQGKKQVHEFDLIMWKIFEFPIDNLIGDNNYLHKQALIDKIMAVILLQESQQLNPMGTLSSLLQFCVFLVFSFCSFQYLLLIPFCMLNAM